MLLSFLSQAQVGTRNQRNSYRLQQGMTLSQALRLMGPAQRTEVNPLSPQEVVYTYDPPALASSEVAFSVGPNRRVTHISHGLD
ncbi:hypothetical protein [Hymenobacter sp. GOD-10R]|uniref:hypothetical protein n=1 Tax=Hymenobacter sp. GOD-10R TaxID=3093922 RepID=UPI002D79A13E|nr:hypothetical protein [Hymenobacter sp. GOD-10R]WRQ31897.1 hypothetical protein SD425_29120 [Hymenobacter sp. GOD-10R]